MVSLDTQEIKNESDQAFTARVTVMGVGGGGSNMVNSMIDSGYENVSFVAVNTDMQALAVSKAAKKIQIGVKSTKGLGAGAHPQVGARAAEEDLDKILKETVDSDIVFLLGGLGGGTGSGALGVIARALREKDVLVVAVVTKPFVFEGKQRERIAQHAIEQLKQTVDTLIVLPNQKLVDMARENITLIEAFGMINDLINQFIKAVADIINRPGHINVDFADIKTIMKHKGLALIGSARASGSERAQKAALEALSSQLLESMDIKGAQGILMNITGSTALGLHELQGAASLIYERVSDTANIVLGSVLDDALGDEVAVTIIATGFHDEMTNTTNVEPASSQQTMYSYQGHQGHHGSNIASGHVAGAYAPPNISKSLDTLPTLDEIPAQPDELDIPALIRKKAQEKQSI